MMLYSLDRNPTLASAIAEHLAYRIEPHEERVFPDGERKLRPLLDPRGDDVYVIHSLHGDLDDSPSDKLFRLLMFCATLREHGARHVTAVLPYLAYARKDRLTKPFDPLSLRYVAQMIEAAGIWQVIVVEAHNVAAFQNAFRCITRHIDGHHIFCDRYRRHAPDSPLVVISPDPGGVKRVQLLREALQEGLGHAVGFGMIDKRRSAGVLSGTDRVAGDVDGATALIFDDLIAGGETMRRATKALSEAGAKKIIACATHGLFVAPAPTALLDEHLSEVVVSNTVPTFRIPGNSPLLEKLHIESCAPLLAEVIRQSHQS